ncbi:MAG: hypothetical protein RMJ00_01535 [Nitrososphaerota archaeon]|nr:60S ribosomal protein L38 [Candidatus Bathyarchaeota archaeon]MCX8162738.1 60S ribosomal protein L38 [Candidatus Bathyarchaeota archaeon]MDW8061369.1 hypothetical protein [Nitrososphaerota archaeon]
MDSIKFRCDSDSVYLYIQVIPRLLRADMPKEVFDVEEFIKLSEKAEYCLVKGNIRDGTVKLKLRTRRYLYTLKVKDNAEAEGVLRKVKCPVRRI